MASSLSLFSSIARVRTSPRNLVQTGLIAESLLSRKPARLTLRRHHIHTPTTPVSGRICQSLGGLRWQSTLSSPSPIGAGFKDDVTTHHSLQSSEPCTVKIIDFSDKRVVQHEVMATPPDLENFLREQPKPSWAACRWIYVNGLDATVVKCLGAANNLHRLAIEDVLERSAPTKVDWYNSHCFLVLAWQKLVHGNNTRGSGGFTSYSGEMDREQSAQLPASESGVRKRTRWCTTSHREFGLSSEHVSAFLTADDTVITIFESSGEEVLKLVMHHLDSARTILRTSNDPSMLLHAVIDAVVDLAVPIERTIAEAFTELESTVLQSPDIGQSKELYRLRSALIVLMDDIAAIGTVVKSLCDHRQAPSLPVPEGELGDADKDALVPISPLAQVYLQDVNDHIEMLAKSTQRGVHSAENLTSLIFNTIAARQNASLQRLT